MDPARIAALLEPFLEGCPTSDSAKDLASLLTQTQLDQISTYIDLLLRWNARINLTAIRNPEEIVTRHFGESFFLARHLFPDVEQHQPESHPESGPISPTALKHRSSATQQTTSQQTIADHSRLVSRSSKRVIDIGSGAGFPALPLKIWAPHIQLTLIESNHKKAAFLREVVRSLTLTNINVIAERAEHVLTRLRSDANTTSPTGAGLLRPAPSGSARFPSPPDPGPSDSTHSASRVRRPTSATSVELADIVTFRAVEKFDKILPLAIRLLAPQGHLALLVSSPQLPQLDAIPAAKWHKYAVPQSQSRLLLVSSSSDQFQENEKVDLV